MAGPERRELCKIIWRVERGGGRLITVLNDRDEIFEAYDDYIEGDVQL